VTGQECYDVWAPADAAWSAWAKPVLFAQLAEQIWTVPDGEAPNPVDVFWAPSAGRTAIIIDLPEADSVRFGLALASRGYRPVPLYNTSFGAGAVVNAEVIARELLLRTRWLQGITLAKSAPPVFLLDASRMSPTVLPAPGRYDNRWVVFPQDFPSGSYLRANGITDVLLVHGDKGLQDDLAHVLLRWQQLGVKLLAHDVSARGHGQTRELRVTPPSLARRLWYRVIALAGLRRNNAGGFGAIIPVPSSGGHG
jgi:hypothetical protein